MGNVEMHDLAPVRDDERRELDISRKFNHKNYCKHTNGDYPEACLTELPWAIVDSVSLYERMDASFNCISEIPVELPLRLPHLSFLNLSHNKLCSLPESFALLFHLKTVLLNHNSLKTLPTSFIHLVKLGRLDLSNNLLRELPEEIGSMENLTKLNVSHNKLKALPPSLGMSRRLEILLASHNRLDIPPQSICNDGSAPTLKFMRTRYRYQQNGTLKPEKPVRQINVFPRVRGNQLMASVSNLHSAQAQYIQAQTSTSNTPWRVKTPLMPPHDASQLDTNDVRDRILGLIYGAAIGDAIGIATEFMTPDECNFHYTAETLTYANIVRDEHRSQWRRGDWTADFDQFALVLDCLIHWAGVIDELDFAKRMKHWYHHGYKELSDPKGFNCCATIDEVVTNASFEESPHSVAMELVAASNESDGPADRFADNGALPRALMLGVPGFHSLAEVEANAVRICKATHADPRCLASAVMLSAIVALLLQGKDKEEGGSEEDLPPMERLIREAKDRALKYIDDTDQIKEFERYASLTDNESLNVHEKARVTFSLKTLAAGLVALRRNVDYRTTITDLTLLGGDSNTHACIAGALQGCRLGYSRLDTAWLEGLRTKQQLWINTKVNTFLDMMGIP